MSEKQIAKKETKDYNKIKVGSTSVFPVVVKITMVFTILLFVSNFITNLLNLSYTNLELTRMMKDLLVKDLKELYFYSNTQHEIFKFNNDEFVCARNIEKKAQSQFKNNKSVAIGLKPDASLFFNSTAIEDAVEFEGISIIQTIKDNTNDLEEGVLSNFKFNNDNYFGVYKYNSNWDIYIIRGEEKFEYYMRLIKVFGKVLVHILFLTILCAVFGVWFLKRILRFLKVITLEILDMLEKQKLRIINLDKATNDDVTLLGVAFNSLSSTIDNLMQIFLKFVNKDVAQKAYKDRQIRLEGSEKELVMLFSDIRSFTFMTEQLGIDIIKLLNIHYENAIGRIIKYDGVIGAIIGDALLAMFGVFEEETQCNKSYNAVMAAYEVQQVTAELRKAIEIKRKGRLAKKKKLTVDEERVFKAIMINVGVGIDGGIVFYGNIGSSDRMTNTVIGDKVNASSRLEGLTKVYKVPVICSEFVKNEIIECDRADEIIFVELDLVMVKGKTEGTRIYWPILKKDYNKKTKDGAELFLKGLSLYYEGNWRKAITCFNKCTLPVVDVFKDRIKGKESPKGWKGVWQMTTK